jgi:probable HAF family extracellular repeat protein
MRDRLLVLGFVCGLATIGAPAAHATAFFTGLGFLPGGTSSGATAVSADGSTVVGQSFAGTNQAFRWTAATGMVSLGTVAASDVSGDGTVVVGTSAGQAFRWTAASGVVGLGALPGTSGGSLATGVSADGTVVVGGSDSASPDVHEEPFRWTASEGMVGLGFSNPNHPAGEDVLSRATAVSADGSVIVGATFILFDDPVIPWRWTPEDGMVNTNFQPGLGSFDARPVGVSSDGAIVVGVWTVTMDSPHEAYLWTADGGLVPLGDLEWDGDPFDEPSESDSGANAVSDAGVVVGFGQSSSPISRRNAFVWDAANGMRSLRDVLEAEYGLDLTGWTLTSATDITPDGLTIVGTGIGPGGTSQAWLVHLPEPGATGLLALGLAGVAGRGRWLTPRRWSPRARAASSRAGA